MFDVIRYIIRDNILSDQQESVLLTQGVNEYLDCLELRHAQLNNLFKRDEAHWVDNAKIAKKKAAGIKDKMKEFYKK